MRVSLAGGPPSLHNINLRILPTEVLELLPKYELQMLESVVIFA